MATIPHVKSTEALPDPIFGEGVIHTFLWETLTEADVCEALEINGKVLDISIQVVGTFGGASVAVHGSNDGTNFSALKDETGSVIALSSAGIAGLSLLPRQIKPVASGGSSQDLDIYICARTAR